MKAKFFFNVGNGVYNSPVYDGVGDETATYPIVWSTPQTGLHTHAIKVVSKVVNGPNWDFVFSYTLDGGVPGVIWSPTLSSGGVGTTPTPSGGLNEFTIPFTNDADDYEADDEWTWETVPEFEVLFMPTPAVGQSNQQRIVQSLSGAEQILQMGTKKFKTSMQFSLMGLEIDNLDNTPNTGSWGYRLAHALHWADKNFLEFGMFLYQDIAEGIYTPGPAHPGVAYRGYITKFDPRLLSLVEQSFTDETFNPEFGSSETFYTFEMFIRLSGYYTYYTEWLSAQWESRSLT